MGQLLRYSLKLPKHVEGVDDFKYLCAYFIDDVIKCFKDNEYSPIKDGVVHGGAFLIGYKGKLYSVESDFQVAKSSKPYCAAGCGEDYALGAMYQLHEREFGVLHGNSAETKIIKTLETAAEFSGGVCDPFNIVSI
jgi:hypothetical protein